MCWLQQLGVRVASPKPKVSGIGSGGSFGVRNFGYPKPEAKGSERLDGRFQLFDKVVGRPEKLGQVGQTGDGVAGRSLEIR
jgi:hypothetical protein